MKPLSFVFLLFYLNITQGQGITLPSGAYNELNHYRNPPKDSIAYYDSIYNVKLLYYTANCPQTIGNEFTPQGCIFSDNMYCKIYNVEGYANGLLRHDAIFQFMKPGRKLFFRAVLLNHGQEKHKNISGYGYSKIKVLAWQNRWYYISTFYAIDTVGQQFYGIKLFTINDTVVNDTISMIRINDKLCNEIIYPKGSLRKSLNATLNKHNVYFDEAKEAIFIPKTQANERGELEPVEGYIEYKFKDGVFTKVD